MYVNGSTYQIWVFSISVLVRSVICLPTLHVCWPSEVVPSCLSLYKFFLVLMETEGKTALYLTSPQARKKIHQSHTYRWELTHWNTDTHTYTDTHDRGAHLFFSHTHTLPLYLSNLTRLCPDLLLCFEYSFDKWALSRRQRGHGGGLMRRSGSR